MKSLFLIMTILFLLFNAILGQELYKPNEGLLVYIVKGAEQKSKGSNDVRMTNTDLRQHFQNNGISEENILPAFPDFVQSDTLKKAGSRTVKLTNKARIFKINVPKGHNRIALADRLSQHPLIGYAEPDGYAAVDNTPYDEKFDGEQWNMENWGQTGGTWDADVDAIEAWKIYTGSTSNKIAIIDLGVDRNHDDLSGKVSGHTTTYGDHGTNVASVAAAKANNIVNNAEYGIAGIDWNAQIIAKAFWNGWSSGDAYIHQIIDEAVNEGAHVLNNSWKLLQNDDTPDRYSTTVRLAFADAYKQNRVAVAAAGNTALSGNHYQYPAGFDHGIITVAATNDDDRRYTLSTYHDYVDVSAPGEDIIMADPSGEFFIDSGTSYAAPLVAGIASLMKGYNSSLYNDDIEQIIRLSIKDINDPSDDTTEEGWDKGTGTGRVNARKALDFLREPWELTHASTTGGTVYEESQATYTKFYGVPGLLDGYAYLAKRYEIRKTVNLSTDYHRQYAWGRGVGTTGFFHKNPNYGFGWCDIVNSTSSSITLRTYIFEVATAGGQEWDFYPTTASNVNFNYTILNIPKGTNVSGSISSNQTWSGNKTVTGDITVSNGATLTIQPGTTIYFDGDYKIEVNSGSKIIANGTSSSPIAFTSDETRGEWKYIKLYGGNNSFKWCTFEYGERPIYMYNCDASEGSWNLIEDCMFRENSSTGVYMVGGVAAIRENFSKDNSYNGFRFYNTTEVHLTGNTIKENDTNGIFSYTNNNIKLYGNVIQNNDDYGVWCRNGDIITIGAPYSWNGKNTIRANGSHEVYAYSGNPNVDICQSSIHDATGFEIYNYTGNQNVEAIGAYWGSDNTCSSSGNISNQVPTTSEPSYEGIPQVSGSPLNKTNGGETYPRKRSPELVEHYKNLLNTSPKSSAAIDALEYLYCIVRKDYVDNVLNEKDTFYSYLENLQNKNSKTALGNKATKYMMFWKMTEGDFKSAISLGEDVLSKSNGEAQKLVLVDLFHCHLFLNDVKKAQNLLTEFKTQFGDEKQLIRDMEEVLADNSENAEPGSEQIAGSENPSNSVLLQNHPNPGNPSTTIQFYLPKDQHVTLEIYNMLGQHVFTVVDGYREKGYVSATWNGRNNQGNIVPSGVYLYRLRTEEQSISKKLMLLR